MGRRGAAASGRRSVTRSLSHVARLTARIGLLATVGCVVVLVAVQLEVIVAKNVAIARQVANAHRQIVALRERERAQQRTVDRLSDPRGAIPEIHEKLQLVAPHQELIYVRGLAQPTPAPNDDWPSAP